MRENHPKCSCPDGPGPNHLVGYEGCTSQLAWVCPRCEGSGGDPHLHPPQSCLVCWGQGWINPHKEVWTGQNVKALEGYLGEHSRIRVVADGE